MFGRFRRFSSKCYKIYTSSYFNLHPCEVGRTIEKIGIFINRKKFSFPEFLHYRRMAVIWRSGGERLLTDDYTCASSFNCFTPSLSWSSRSLQKRGPRVQLLQDFAWSQQVLINSIIFENSPLTNSRGREKIYHLKHVPLICICNDWFACQFHCDKLESHIHWNNTANFFWCLLVTSGFFAAQRDRKLHFTNNWRIRCMVCLSTSVQSDLSPLGVIFGHKLQRRHRVTWDFRRWLRCPVVWFLSFCSPSFFVNSNNTINYKSKVW